MSTNDKLPPVAGVLACIAIACAITAFYVFARFVFLRIPGWPF